MLICLQADGRGVFIMLGQNGNGENKYISVLSL